MDKIILPNRDYLVKSAQRFIRSYPHFAEKNKNRILKSLDLALSGSVRQQAPAEYIVLSQSSNKAYRVHCDVYAAIFSCDCPDGAYHLCKHVLAARFATDAHVRYMSDLMQAQEDDQEMEARAQAKLAQQLAEQGLMEVLCV